MWSVSVYALGDERSCCIRSPQETSRVIFGRHVCKCTGVSGNVNNGSVLHMLWGNVLWNRVDHSDGVFTGSPKWNATISEVISCTCVGKVTTSASTSSKWSLKRWPLQEMGSLPVALVSPGTGQTHQNWRGENNLSAPASGAACLKCALASAAVSKSPLTRCRGERREEGRDGKGGDSCVSPLLDHLEKQLVLLSSSFFSPSPSLGSRNYPTSHLCVIIAESAPAAQEHVVMHSVSSSTEPSLFTNAPNAVTQNPKVWPVQ